MSLLRNKIKYFKPGISSLIAFWVFTLILVDISGEFPLIDDWAYVKSVFAFTELNQVIIYDRIAITFFSNLIWGTAFVKLFGFSFLILRISSVVAAIILLFTFYKILSFFTSNESIKIISTSFLAFNPLFYLLSLTFMTDVFFLMLSFISIFFFLSFFKKRNLNYLIMAFLFSIIATLSRQVGLIIPISFVVIFILNKPLKNRETLLVLLGLFVNIFSLIIYYTLLKKNSLTPSHYTLHTNSLLNDLSNFDLSVIKRWSFYLYTSIVSLLILLSPLFFSLIKWNKINKKRFLYSFGISTLITCLINFFRKTSFPFNGDIINDYGMGGYFFSNAIQRVDQLSYQIPVAINIIIITWALSLFIYFISSNFESLLCKVKKSNQIKFLILCMILYYPTFGLVFVFDRYLLLILILSIPVLVYFMENHINPTYKTICILMIGISGMCSVICTSDYFEYNRVKWKALNHLNNVLNIKTENIDGGMEFNAWFNYENDLFNSNVKKEWWCVKNDHYLITIDKKKRGYKVFKTYPYENWMGIKKRKLFVLKKANI